MLELCESIENKTSDGKCPNAIDASGSVLFINDLSNRIDNLRWKIKKYYYPLTPVKNNKTT